VKINQSVFNRGKKGGDTGRISKTWTLRLTHTDEHSNTTSKTWQYATKQDARDDIEKRKAEIIAFVCRHDVVDTTGDSAAPSLLHKRTGAPSAYYRLGAATCVNGRAARHDGK